MATPEQALEKLRHFCAYQERCHKEVEQKLHQLNVWGEDAAEIISALIQDDFLNEERYACHFARGKFRMKQWGRNKIRYALKGNGLSSYCIKKAMREIDEEAYLKTLRILAERKYNALKSEQYLRRRYKVQQYLIGKGYESDLVIAVCREIVEKKD